MRGPRLALTALALAASTLAAGARAEGPTEVAPPAEQKRAAALSWVRLPGAEDCIDGATLATSVEAKLGRPVFPAPREASLLVEGRAEKTPEGYRAELRMYDTSGDLVGSREVSSTEASCAELSKAVALVLAVMVDPDGALMPPPSPPSPPASPTAPEEPPPFVPPPTPVSAEPARDHQLYAFARGAVGALPDAAIGVGAAFDMRLPRFGGARIAGVGFVEQEAFADGIADAGTRLRLLYAELAYCPWWLGRSRVVATTCVGAQLGSVQSRGFGLDGAQRDTVDPLVNAAASARIGVRVVGALALYAGLGAAVPLTRTLYEARRADGTSAEVWEQGAIVGELDLGIGAAF